MFTACNLFKTVMRGNWDANYLMKTYGSHPVFANFTPRTWAFMGMTGLFVAVLVIF
jgi:hypothetical protein